MVKELKSMDLIERDGEFLERFIEKNYEKDLAL